MPVSTRRTSSNAAPPSFPNAPKASPRRFTRRSLTLSLQATLTEDDDRPAKRTRGANHASPNPLQIAAKMQTSEINQSTPPKRQKSTMPRSARKNTPEPGSQKPPEGWESIYSLVEELRQDRTAPVDTNGSEALPERHRGEKVFRFQVLVALMMSSQTKDPVVGDTMRALQQHGLDVESIARTSHEKLNELIRKVGFHNNKTKYIKQTVEILQNEYDGDIPRTAEDMMKLPGVGPKMAFIVENVAWGTTGGIGIDTHMHRMFNQLGWVKSKNPEQTRVQLEAWLPREHWKDVNLLWVGFGQESQQFKPKILQKALNCSRPRDALLLLKRLGVDVSKEGDKLGLTEQIRSAMNATGSS